MKKLVLVSAIALSILSVNAQKASYNDVATKKIKGLITEYTTKNGETLKIGDTILIGRASNDNINFFYLTQATGMYPLPNSLGGGSVVIKKMKSSMKHLRVNCTSSDVTLYPIYIASLELAIDTKEISLNGMNKEKAIAELKEQKDLLDLGIITEEEYNNKKIELLKYIK